MRALTRWHVITGRPSSGISTTIREIGLLGYKTVPEAARTLIDKGIREGKTLAEIRKDETKFQLDVLKMKIETEQCLKPSELVFLDRGIPDSMAYFVLAGLNPMQVIRATQPGKPNLYARVFLLEPLPFERDYARVEDEVVAEKLYGLLRGAYESLLYTVVSVPVLPIAERVKFIVDRIER